MTHYICRGTCQSKTSEIAACETEGCSNQWEMMEECECGDNLHGSEAQVLVVKDSNGNVLVDGDNVTLIKDLTLRGSSKVIKRGAKVTNLRLTDNPEEVDCKVEGMKIVLRVEFLKKV